MGDTSFQCDRSDKHTGLSLEGFWEEAAVGSGLGLFFGFGFAQLLMSFLLSLKKSNQGKQRMNERPLTLSLELIDRGEETVKGPAKAAGVSAAFFLTPLNFLKLFCCCLWGEKKKKGTQTESVSSLPHPQLFPKAARFLENSLCLSSHQQMCTKAKGKELCPGETDVTQMGCPALPGAPCLERGAQYTSRERREATQGCPKDQECTKGGETNFGVTGDRRL